MPLEVPKNEPTRRLWVGFWSMIAQQTQNAFNDKMAQFTLISLGAAVGFTAESWAGLMIALPFVLFAPIAGWVSDRFSKRNVMLAAAVTQVVVLGWICGAVWMKNLPTALCGFFALATQSAFYSPAKIGSNKELVGSKHLGFAAGIQQMTAMLAILAGQIAAGWLFDRRFSGHGSTADAAWTAALVPLGILTLLSIPALALALLIPKIPAKGGVTFTPPLVVSHFINLAGLWRDAPLRRASFGVAFFWGFAAFINLWAVKLAKWMTHGGERFGTLSSVFLAAGSLGMAAGFGVASLLLRKRIELGWVPLAGVAMTVTAGVLAFLTPGGGWFLTTLGLLAFASAVFLAPLTAWMQDRYPADKRGELQSAVNLQDCLAGMVAVGLIVSFESGAATLGVDAALGFRIQMIFVALVCGGMTFSIIRLLPGDFIRLIGVALIRAIYRVRVLHPERIPKTGGVLLLPNHVTYADAFFISAGCSRPVRFVMDEAFMASPAIRMFVGIFDTMTIRRDQPLEAIRSMIKALKNGDLVCLFPEGQLTRTGVLCELRRGFELTAKKAGHPLIPMWCDGSWGSIFSYERSRFIRKSPDGFPRGLSIAFGQEIAPAEANLAMLRNSLLETSAAAVGNRFRAAGWGSRLPRGKGAAIEHFHASEKAVRRRVWVNGYQIGQVNALQRHRHFSVLDSDLLMLDLPAVVLTFPELFGAKVESREILAPGIWVGGDRLRDVLAAEDLAGEFVFYDFGTRCLEPLMLAGVLHLPCLAVNGTVIAMSMPHPPKSKPNDDDQPGHKPGTWGRLLPGWYLGGTRVLGPAAPAEGLELPAGAFEDAEGFLSWG